MTRLGVALALAFALPAGAAELTRIASSFEPKDPFGMYLDVGFSRTQQMTKIVREHHQRGAVEDVTELRFKELDQRLNFDVRIGLWQDFELRFGVPLVFSKTRRWRFNDGKSLDERTDETNSTIYNNCLQANGELLDPSCPTSGAGRRPMFEVSHGPDDDVWRGGLGDMTFGLAYAFFNQQKDDTKPMWIFGVDYTAPTAERLEPGKPTAPNARGAIGDRIHKYKFYTSFSKRIGVADPYFQLWYTLPFRGPGWYSNCENPNTTGYGGSPPQPSMGRPGNCGTDQWTLSETGIRPAHTGGFVFGSELNAYDEPSKHQKVAIDLRGIATYVSEGRYYNEMSDMFGKLLYTQDYLQIGGSVGFVAHAAEYVHLKARGTLLYNTEHTLTDESIGKDFNGNGTVDITASPIEINPNFDWRADMPSRRFRATETSVWRLDLEASFVF